MNSSDHSGCTSERTSVSENTTNKTNKPLQRTHKQKASPFYARLMRHDWHAKVNGRIRQRGWDDD